MPYNNLEKDEKKLKKEGQELGPGPANLVLAE
jgi:hypothetical protein